MKTALPGHISKGVWINFSLELHHGQFFSYGLRSHDHQDRAETSQVELWEQTTNRVGNNKQGKQTSNKELTRDIVTTEFDCVLNGSWAQDRRPFLWV